MASAVIYSAVPELVGNKNFQDWRRHMRHALACTIIPKISYTGLDVATGTQVCPVPAVAGAPTADENVAICRFETMDNMCLAMIDGKLAPNLLQHGQTRTATLWTHLETAYGICTTSGIYSDYQKTLTFRIDPNIEPSTQLAYLEDLYQTLQSGTPAIVIPPFIWADEIASPTITAGSTQPFQASSAFGVAMPTIIKSPVVSGSSTRQKVNDAWASRALESAVPPRPLAERLSTPVEESLVKRLKYKKTCYQAAGEKALSLWDEHLGATLSVPTVATRADSPIYTPPSLPTNIVVSLPPPQSPIALYILPTLHTDAEMVSLGDNESDYGDDTYVAYANTWKDELKLPQDPP
ncbi:hypothetical protein AN958_03687 [Leucoagaricus sp. SymC.cos]|nr:hypothetical protein AN958_03687 [Leucoagaricus sp. SymC.cos]